MPLTCSQCSRVNPSDALYCYYDGLALGGAGRAGGPINMGSQPFAAPFIFPSGRVCRNFDQLTMACQQDGHEALEALQNGDLANFFSGMGRSDLAQAAREAARAPNRARGLDTLLGLLPSRVLESAKLAVEPTVVNLGELRVGEDRTLNIRLINQGMRLLCGSVSCRDSGWLSLGDASGVHQKHFQFIGEMVLPLHVRGQRLSANPKPLEARLTIESNGGSQTVVVRATVPVRPFPTGVLAGAQNPRQVAEQARARPREAAAFFEDGTVARWYQDNGWNYPVKGPTSSGLAAIQQYFEAHGLARPPKVEISETEVVLNARAGEALRYELEVSTTEDRSVYALAGSNQPWLTVETPTPKRRSAPIWLIVSSVPNQPGETLQARVTVEANGQQRFNVTVTLLIRSNRSAAPAARLVRSEPAPEILPLPAASIAVPMPVLADPVDVPDDGDVPRRTGWKRHLVPAALLILVLLGLVARDTFYTAAPPAFTPPVEEEITLLDEEPRLTIRMHDQPDTRRPNMERPVFQHPTMRFGLLTHDPKKLAAAKRLTFDEYGRSNNTCIRVDGEEYLFGEAPGTWQEREVRLTRDPSRKQWDGYRSVWSLNRVHVPITQTVEVVPGQSSRLLDTCLVRYTIENHDSIAHRIGLRFLLDTYIGANDGVPFTLPGSQELCDTYFEFNARAEIPDFIQALERGDLEDPGTVANVQLRLGGHIEAPDRVTLGAWPNSELGRLPRRDRDLFQGHMTLWAVPVLEMKSIKQLNRRHQADSAVVLYWHEHDLEPGGRREVGFAYGLGNVAASAGGTLALTVGGTLVRGSDFTVTAYVTHPAPNQRLALRLPAGLQLSGDVEQPVPLAPPDAARPMSTVTWKVHAAERGDYMIRVSSSTGAEQSQKVTIRQQSIFD